MIPTEGDIAPDFELPAGDGSSVKLSDFRGRKVILYFYPRVDTSGCTTQACDLRDNMPRIEEKNAVVLGVSPDPVDAVRNFKEKYDLNFTLLADPEHEVCERYAVWKEKSMYGKKYLGVERSTFVIDEDGRIAEEHRGVKPKGHAEAMLRAL